MSCLCTFFQESTVHGHAACSDVYWYMCHAVKFKMLQLADAAAEHDFDRAEARLIGIRFWCALCP